MVGANSIDIVWRQLVNRDKETIATEPRIMTEYTSVSYGNYFVSLLEADLFSDSSGYEYVTLCN